MSECSSNVLKTSWKEIVFPLEVVRRRIWTSIRRPADALYFSTVKLTGARARFQISAEKRADITAAPGSTATTSSERGSCRLYSRGSRSVRLCFKNVHQRRFYRILLSRKSHKAHVRQAGEWSVASTVPPQPVGLFRAPDAISGCSLCIAVQCCFSPQNRSGRSFSNLGWRGRDAETEAVIRESRCQHRTARGFGCCSS